MKTNKTNEQLLKAADKYKASIFFGILPENEGGDAFCTSKGRFSDILSAIVSLVRGNEGKEISRDIMDLMYSATISIMSYNDDNARRFFALMDEMASEKENAKVVQMIPNKK